MIPGFGIITSGGFASQGLGAFTAKGGGTSTQQELCLIPVGALISPLCRCLFSVRACRERAMIYALNVWTRVSIRGGSRGRQQEGRSRVGAGCVGGELFDQP